MCREDLQLREDTKLYPPRFVVKVKASHTAAAEDFRADFKFEGATEDITKGIIFTNGMVHIVISMTYIYIYIYILCIIVFHSPKEPHLLMASRKKFEFA